MADPEQSSIEKENERSLNERVRAIEQIKRLYAVVIGFAVFSGISNSVQIARVIWKDGVPYEALSFLVTEVLVILSLVALFALSSERMLERRYLRPYSPVPTALHMLFDLFTIGIPAVCFVILASIFPNLQDVADNPGLLQSYFKLFCWTLAIFYLSNCILLLLGHMWRPFNGSQTESDEVSKDYRIWLVINAAFAAVMFVLVTSLDSFFKERAGGINLAAMIVLALHLIRFCLDYFWTFKGYYPQRSLLLRS